MNLNWGKIAAILAIVGFATFITIFNQEQTGLALYANWKQQFSVHFDSSSTDYYRLQVFNQNLKQIQAHNSNSQRTFNMGINQFTGLTTKQFGSIYLGTYSNGPIEVTASGETQKQLVTTDIDWVSAGAVTQIKNQGQCSSCWAFSATGSLQGLYKTQQIGSLRSFSEQQLVDCSGRYGNMGCNGGTIVNAFNFVKDRGIVTDAVYPYKAIKQQCKVPAAQLFKISGYGSSTGCNQLMNALISKPVSVIVDAASWSSYSNGIFNKCPANPNLNHGVLVVGSQGGSWKVKNSWGNAWGQHGYIRLPVGNPCGICNMLFYPVK